MSKISEISTRIQVSPIEPANERRVRALAPIPRNLICMVLLKHHETEKALKVSTSADSSKAKWIPRSMVMLDPEARGDFLVATMLKTSAEERTLSAYGVFREANLTEQQQADLKLAEGLAARGRNRLRVRRGDYSYLGFNGRNDFA